MEDQILDKIEPTENWSTPVFLKRMKITMVFIYIVAACNFIAFFELVISGLITLETNKIQVLINIAQGIMVAVFSILLFLAARGLNRYCKTQFTGDFQIFSNQISTFFLSITVVILVLIFLMIFTGIFHR